MKQNNKTLIIVVSIAVLIFLSALIWKQTHSSNAEVVNFVEKEEIKKIKPKKRDIKRHTPKQQEDDTKVVTVISHKNGNKEDNKIEVEEWSEPVLLDIKTVKEVAGQKMFLAMKYKSPEDLVKAIKQAQGTNNTKQADSLISFLLENYPDYELPADF